MNNQVEIVRQLQQAFELATRENVELREQIIMLEEQINPDKDLKISNLQKTVIMQQQQLSQLKKESLQKNKLKQDYSSEDEQFVIKQLNLKLEEKTKEIKQNQETLEKLKQQIKDSQNEIMDLRERINEQCQKNAEQKQRVTQMELMMKNFREQEPVSLQYILEIERLTSKISEMQKPNNYYI